MTELCPVWWKKPDKIAYILNLVNLYSFSQINTVPKKTLERILPFNPMTVDEEKLER